MSAVNNTDNTKIIDKKERLISRDFALTMAVSAIVSLGNGMFSPALPIYAQSIGITTDIVGGIVSFSLFLCMFGRFIIGGLSATHSRKKLVLVALSMLFVSYIIFFFADNVYILAAAKIIQAVGSGMNITVLSTLAFEFLPQSRMGEGIGIFSLAASLAQSFAPMLGTMFAKMERFNLLFTLSAVSIAVSIVILLRIKERPLAGSAEATANVKIKPKFDIWNYIYPPAFLSALMLLFNGITFSAISNFLSIYGLSKGIASVGLFFTIQSFAVMAARPVCGKLADSKPPAVVIIPGLALATAACALIALADGMAFICMAAVLYGLGFGASQAAIQIMAVRGAPPEKRGVANSTFYVGGDLGLSAGSALAGILAYRAGYESMYLTMACISALSIVVFVLFNSRRKKII